MLKRLSLSLGIVCALFLVGCTKPDTNSSTPTNQGATTSKPASTPATTASTAGEKIGVPECDEFIAAYDACVSGKVPEAARAQYKASIEQWRSSWKKLAANPATKATLAAACKQSAESARTSMKTYGCTF